MLVFSFNGGAHALHLPVYGTCNAAPAPRVATIRGPAAQPDNFLPTFNFRESEAHAVPLPKAKRPTLRGPDSDLPPWVRNPPMQVRPAGPGARGE